jgi:uncharacterized protein YceK
MAKFLKYSAELLSNEGKIMRVMNLAALAAVGVCLSGCATIVDGTTQSVSVSTAPAQGANCTLTNSQGTWYLSTPGSTVVHKTKTDLEISCSKEGYGAGHVVAVAHFGGATFGNVIAGGVIGAGIDAASGANYYYDTPIMVPLGAPQTFTQSGGKPVS